MAKIIALSNQKGGVGKSITTASLGIGLARYGKKVLLIDCDPQASLTISLGYRTPNDLPTTLAHVLSGIVQDKPLPASEGIICHGEGVKLMPAKKNEGEVPQYYVENSHPAIVTPELFDLVQAEIQKNGTTGKRRSNISPFSCKLICPVCGEFYNRKTWRSTQNGTPVKRQVWQCGGKYRERGTCCRCRLCPATVSPLQ